MARCPFCLYGQLGQFGFCVHMGVPRDWGRVFCANVCGCCSLAGASCSGVRVVFLLFWHCCGGFGLVGWRGVTREKVQVEESFELLLCFVVCFVPHGGGVGVRWFPCLGCAGGGLPHGGLPRLGCVKQPPSRALLLLWGGAALRVPPFVMLFVRVLAGFVLDTL